MNEMLKDEDQMKAFEQCTPLGLWTGTSAYYAVQVCVGCSRS